ncbi:hypothetical protein LEP1GSC161_0680 [Leptospira santarosai str. CBC1416]|uniref:Uncharacterized protein n=2 Tax=Leptospira santarosai TaxID=28183 RepID=A0A0E2BC42_9LEPT|nr:hypothetical protein LEP1GSC179_0075 [Leptospira santarosai str. MOR084]EMO57360.1 hypothetical protein LEP1GSC161_0680 [Leptospira santarosai str. CBC1416]
MNIGKFRERISEQRANLRKLQDKTGQSTQNLRRQNRTRKNPTSRMFFQNKGTSSFSCETKKASGRIC